MPFALSPTQAAPPATQGEVNKLPPFDKGGWRGFIRAGHEKIKSPSVPLFQRGKWASCHG